MKKLICAAVLTVLGSMTFAQDGPTNPKTVYFPRLEGGVVFVEGRIHVEFVGGHYIAPDAPELRTYYYTALGRDRALVSIREKPIRGQSTRSWRMDHARLVRKVRAAYPAAGRE